LFVADLAAVSRQRRLDLSRSEQRQNIVHSEVLRALNVYSFIGNNLPVV
jgi:hypothetical protein